MLGLSPAEGTEIEFRSELNDKIIEVGTTSYALGGRLTHSDVARLARTSRTRVTAMNRHAHYISTDLMLRVLASLGGVQAKLQFKSAA